MKKVMMILGAAVLAAGVAVAETDYVAMPVIQDIQKGRDTINQIVDFRCSGDARVGDDLTVVGDASAATVAATAGATVGTTLNVGTKFSGTKSATIQLVDGSVITNSSMIMFVKSAGSTNTLAPASAAGQVMFVLNASAGGGSTGIVVIAAASTNYAGPALSLAAGEMAVFASSAASDWYAIGE